MDITYWQPDQVSSEEQLAEVLARHKASSATLGPMPDAGFRDRARNHGLVLATVDGHVGGYALYDIPRHHTVKLVHLCVGLEHRRTGMAKAMVDFIIAANPTRTALVAACRKDYNLAPFWRSLGLSPSAEKPGRALGGSTLVMWVRPIGPLNLFEDADINSGLPLAVLDTNIITALYSSDPRERATRDAAVALENDWVGSAVTFVISPEVSYDLSQISDDKERKHQMAAIASLTRLRSKRPDDAELERELHAKTGQKEMAKDKSLREDLKQIADAVHARADYFVTNDENLIRTTGAWLFSDYGLRVLLPHQLVLELRPDTEGPGFESKLIDAFDLVWRSAADVDDKDLELTYLNYTEREKPKAFQKLLRSSLARLPAVTSEALFDAGGRSWALLSCETVAESLVVRMIRTVRGQRGVTVAHQLMRHLRRRALAEGLAAIRVEDPSISATMQAALEQDGFSNGPTPAARLAQGRPTLEDFIKLERPQDLPGSHAFQVLQLERRYWPVLFSGAKLPTYIVPIRPRYAELLFGYTDALMTLSRARGLGLSREHVYFCSPRAPLTEFPGRILWYVTADDSAEVRQLGIRSTVIGSTVMSATVAYERFGMLGVLGKEEILSASDDRGMVRVVKFENTERLERPLPRRTMGPLLKRHNVKGNIMTARMVPPLVFDDVMHLQAEPEGIA